MRKSLATIDNLATAIELLIIVRVMVFCFVIMP